MKKISFSHHKFIKSAQSVPKEENIFTISLNGQELTLTKSQLMDINKEVNQLNSVFSHLFMERLGRREGLPYYSQELKDELQKVLTVFPNNFTTDNVAEVLGIPYAQAMSRLDRWGGLYLVHRHNRQSDHYAWSIKSLDDLIEPTTHAE